MARKTADIFSQFEHIRERMEQAYRQVLGTPGSPGFCPPYMEPPADVYETGGEIVVLVEMAGISGEEIELEIEGRTLVLEGRRRPLRGRPSRIYAQMEIPSGPFRREFLLPAEVNGERATATYKDGILEVVLPKSAPGPSRQLRIIAR